MRSKRKYLIGTVFLLAILLLTCWVIGTYINYHSVHIKSTFSQEELKKVYDEYHLTDNAHIEYLFSSGNDLYGVRLSAGSLDNISDIFACDLNFADENGCGATVRYYSSSGCVDAIDMSKYSNLLDENFIGMWYFEMNNTPYIEITKMNTRNVGLYT